MRGLQPFTPTCFPGCEDYSPSLSFVCDGVVEDGNIITAKSVAYAWPLVFTLVERLLGSEAAGKLEKAIYWNI